MPEVVKGLADDTALQDDVAWPQNAFDADGKDLAKPVSALLRKLALLETKEDAEKGVGPVAGTPYSLQVITAGATSGAKVAGVAASSASFTGALASAWAAARQSQLPLQIALVAAGGLILAAGVIAVAIIVQSDVRARGSATDAVYRARAAVTTEFLRQAATKATPQAVPSPALALLNALSAFPGKVKVKSADGGEQRVTGIANRNEGLQIRLADGDWIRIADVTSFDTEGPATRR